MDINPKTIELDKEIFFVLNISAFNYLAATELYKKMMDQK
jgi:hypothetical protein